MVADDPASREKGLTDWSVARHGNLLVTMTDGNKTEGDYPVTGILIKTILWLAVGVGRYLDSTVTVFCGTLGTRGRTIAVGITRAIQPRYLPRQGPIAHRGRDFDVAGAEGRFDHPRSKISPERVGKTWKLGKLKSGGNKGPVGVFSKIIRISKLHGRGDWI